MPTEIHLGQRLTMSRRVQQEQRTHVSAALDHGVEPRRLDRARSRSLRMICCCANHAVAQAEELVGAIA